MRNGPMQACAAVVVLAASAFGSAVTCAADAPGLAPPGLYRSTRADIVLSGRACGNGAPLVPAFVLSIVAPNAQNAPTAVGVLRDDGGVAMPVVPVAASGGFALADLTEPPPGNAIGDIAVLRADSAPWVAVDYRYLDSDCRVTGTIAFERVVDEALATQTDVLVRAMDAMGRRDALRAAGKSRAAMEPGLVAQSLLASALGDEHWLTLNAGTNLASLHKDVDEFATARARYEDLVPRIARTLGPDHFQVWRARQNLALVLWDLGELDAAESMLRSVVERYTSMLGADDTHRLGTLTNLATLMNVRGRIVEAERIMFDVLQRFERLHGPNHPRTMIALNNLANVFFWSGRLDDALLHQAAAMARYEQSLGPRHPATLRASANRFGVLARMGRTTDAMAGLRDVLAVRREVLGPRHSETLGTQQALASLIADAGNADEAMQMQRDVVEGREATNGLLHNDTLMATALLGRMETRHGTTAVGLARMRDVHVRATDALGRFDRTTLEIGALLATAEREAGDLRASRATFAAVVEGVEAWREIAATSPSGRRDLFTRWAAAYKALAAVELALGDVPAAFRQSERSKARVLAETLALRRGEVRDVLPPDALAALGRLDRELADVETQLARAPREASARFLLEERRTALSDEAVALRRELRARYPKYAALSEARIVDVAEGARELPRDALLVSYLREGGRVLAFTVDHRGETQGHDLGSIPDLDETVRAYRVLLTTRSGTGSPPVWRLDDGRYRIALEAPRGAVRVTDPRVVGRELAARLVAPLPELVRSRRWIVSPDSALALVPFETLPWRGRALVATREITYAPSLTVYALTARRGRDYDRAVDRAPLYAMGAANYDATPDTLRVASSERTPLPSHLESTLAADPDGVRRAYDVIGARWPALPASAQELRDVAAHFRSAGAVTLRSAHEATEAKLKDDDLRGTLARHRYVLLSAHGYLSTDAPSLSAVVLGQRDVTPEADGYVTAAEWAGYTLRSDLIVISACETGAGKVIEGEGVAGLPYALFVAGNRNALLTLWPVADRSTAQFVARFFGHLRAGMSQSAALTRTKREFASSGPYTAPLHWAPFVLWGS